MTQTIVLVDKATDYFDNLVDKTNELANLVSNTVVTANSNANGSITAGNAQFTGIFSIATLGVGTALRGGNVQTAAELPISSNVYVTGTIWKIGNSTVNATSNNTSLIFTGGSEYAKTFVSVGNSTVNAVGNSTSLYFNAAQYYTGTGYYVGNSTVNAVATSTQLGFNGKVSYTGTSWYVGSTTVNAIANSTAFKLANSTVSLTIVKPTAAVAADGNYWLRSDGAWANVSDLVLKVYDSANSLLFP
jgi:hypothetical protein